MDKAAVSRAQSHGVTLNVKFSGLYPRGQKGERLESYLVATGCEIVGSEEDRKSALADLVNFLTPAPIREIEKWIAELSVITAGRGREGFDAELLISAYSARLSKYPADVSKHALLGVTHKWFPSWAELETICEAKSGPRRHMVRALGEPVSKPEPDRRPPTQQERDRIAELIADQFPSVPQAWRDQALDEAASGDCMSVDGGADGV